jgi:hypothetical protein
MEVPPLGGSRGLSDLQAVIDFYDWWRSTTYSLDNLAFFTGGEVCDPAVYPASGLVLQRQFKPPSLRNVAERAPYMHAGQFDSLNTVLARYNSAPAAP